jgi:hypothetical protein
LFQIVLNALDYPRGLHPQHHGVQLDILNLRRVSEHDPLQQLPRNGGDNDCTQARFHADSGDPFTTEHGDTSYPSSGKTKYLESDQHGSRKRLQRCLVDLLWLN